MGDGKITALSHSLPGHSDEHSRLIPRQCYMRAMYIYGMERQESVYTEAWMFLFKHTSKTHIPEEEAIQRRIHMVRLIRQPG